MASQCLARSGLTSWLTQVQGHDRAYSRVPRTAVLLSMRTRTAGACPQKPSIGLQKKFSRAIDTPEPVSFSDVKPPESRYGNGTEIPDGSNVLVTPQVKEFKKPTDLDYLQELLAIQQSGPKNIGFFGTRNMGFMHQQLIEILSYAMVITENHIFTSGATGTNAAVIRGALRAEKPDLLTVVLPQSLSLQPPESQELLKQVQNVIAMPHNDKLPLLEASRICNRDILSRVQQVICFAFHDSRLLLETCDVAKEMRKIVTLFFLD